MMRAGKVPLVLQDEVADCGLACVAMISGAYGRHMSLAALRRQVDIGVHGASLKDLAFAGESLGFDVRSIKLGTSQVDQLRLPALLHWNLVHFVVLVERRGKHYVVHDPGLGRRTIDESEFFRSFTGLAQEFSPRSDFSKLDERTAVPLRWILDHSQSYLRLLGTVAMMSMVMQAFVLLLPYGARLLVDRLAIAKDDLSLAATAGVGTTLLALFCVLHWFRAMVVVQLSTCLDTYGSRKLVDRMFGLTYEFLARRDIGTLMSRFSNLREVRLVLSQGLAESAVEALLAVIMLAGIYVHSPAASVTAVAALLAYAVCRLAIREKQKERVDEMFVAMGSQNASLIESLSKVETVKANAIETTRSDFWQSRFTEYQNSLVLKLRLDHGSTIAAIACFGLGYIVACWIAVRSAFLSQLTLGEVTTVLVLLGMFLSRGHQFISKVFDLGVARVHLDALADVVYGDSESQPGSRDLVLDRAPSIELRDVGFRYSPRDPFVFRRVSFRVEAGESAAITGLSGCGKSTLLSLILGLRRPTEGEILIDGIPLEQCDKAKYRRRVGSVLQADRLFFGSVAENVSLFELEANMEHVWNALNASAMAAVVGRLPMGEHTTLGDSPMLSGGEVQRLLLARALYKNPKLLLLDEASSHLDEDTEVAVNASLSATGATRLVAAHRRQTIDLSDCEIVLGHESTLGCSSVTAVRRRPTGHHRQLTSGGPGVPTLKMTE